MNEKLLGRSIDKFKDKKIAILGDLMLDRFIYGESTRISPEAPVPIVLVSREIMMPGGAGNVAMNIASLGGKVFMMGLVGKDSAGDFLSKNLKKRGVNIKGLVQNTNYPTAQKSRVISAGQQVVRIDKEEKPLINSKIEKKFIKFVKENISNWDGVVISDYAKGFITSTLAKSTINLARKNKKFIICDVKPVNALYFKNATIITPNHHEAFAITGTNNLKKAGRILQDKLKCDVLITQGGEGMTLFSGKNIEHFPTEAREVFDITGAGDTVTAILALALATQISLKDATFLANLGAGIVVGKAGTATLTPQELKQQLNEEARN